MFPVLLEIPIFGGIRIYTYGVLVALAFVSAIGWTTREARLAHIKKDFVLDLAFYIVLAALAGARVLYILVDWERYVAHPAEILKVWEGGLVFYGGLLGSIAVSFYYIRKHGYRFFQIADVFMPAVALGHAIGRLGCFAAGCCYGREAGDFPLAVVFPLNHFSLAPAGIPLLPSQLFESATALVIFGILIFIRRHKKFEGQIFISYLILYGIARSLLELTRGDSIRGYIVPGILTTSQGISGLLILAAITVYLYWRQRHHTVKAKGRSS